MEEDIQNYLPTVMFRGTLCSSILSPDSFLRTKDMSKTQVFDIIIYTLQYSITNFSRLDVNSRNLSYSCISIHFWTQFSLTIIYFIEMIRGQTQHFGILKGSPLTQTRCPCKIFANDYFSLDQNLNLKASFCALVSKFEF